MPRDFPQPLLDLLKSPRGLFSAITLDIYIDDRVANANTDGMPTSVLPAPIALHYATHEITANGVSYQAKIPKGGAGRLVQDQSKGIDSAQIQIENYDDKFARILTQTANIIQASACTLGIYWQDEFGTPYWEQLFQGTILSAPATREVVTLTLTSDIYSARSVGATRRITRKCGWEYKGADGKCGSTSTLLTCNKLLTNDGGCSARHSGTNNRARHGGFSTAAPANTVTAAIGLATQPRTLFEDSGGTFFLRPNVKATGVTFTDNPGENRTDAMFDAGFAVKHAVRDFAAVGDGVADDTAELQAAIDAAEAAGGGVVYVPAGTYKVTGLTIVGNVTLRSFDDRMPIIYSTSNAPIIETAEDAAFELPKIENIRIRGDVAAGSSQVGLKCDADPYGLRCVVRNVWIENCGGVGLYVKRVFSSIFENVFVTNCEGFPFLIEQENMPGTVFRNCYPGNLRAAAPVGFRVKTGQAILYNCNGINSVPSGAQWARVGRKNGVDGDVVNSGAILRLIDCNIESFDTIGIKVYHGSTVDLRGRTTFAGNAGASQKAIDWEHINDGSDYNAQYLMHGIIDDTVDISDSVTPYLNSQPFHCNGHLPMQVCGEGPLAGGSPNAKISSYYDSTAAATTRLRRADGKAAKLTITATTTIAQPGVRYIEVNNGTAGQITITLPWPGWYRNAQEILVIKDVAGNAGDGTHSTIIQSGGGGTVAGTSAIFLNKNSQCIILEPNGETSGSDWRVLSSWPEFVLISEAGSNVTVSGTLTVTSDIYTRAFSASGGAMNSIVGRRGRGTEGTPAAVQSGDVLLYQQGQGYYNSSSIYAGAFVTITAAENWDATHAGASYTVTVNKNAGSTDGFQVGVKLDGSDSGNLNPTTDNTQGLGNATKRWTHIRVGTVNFNDGTSQSTAGGGGGTVTSFSASDFSPLFTTTEANPTTTPALSFTAVNQNANLGFYGPASGAAAAPTFRAPVIADFAGLVREKLSAARTYYVRTDGSDSNNGLANTAGGAFLTIQKAIDVASALDNAGFQVTVQIGNGTYTGAVVLKTFVGSGELVLQGDTTTPANVTISVTSPSGGGAVSGFFVVGSYRLKGLKLTTSTVGHGINLTSTVLYIESCEFGAVPTGYAHMAILVNSQVYIYDYRISGNAQYHYFVRDGSYLQCYNRTITIVGTPTIGVFCYVETVSWMLHALGTFSGAITAGAQRYSVSLNSVINTGAGGEAYFPGTVAGSKLTGGQYV